MDTSPSPSWRATALAFSGRPDPEWDVPEGEAAALAAAFSTLPAADPVAAAPPLGYRGVRLDAPDGRSWTAYGGVVASGTDTRDDAGREWERRLLVSAPDGTLPSFVGFSE